MDFENMTPEEIDKTLKSLENISKIFNDMPDVEETKLIAEKQVETNKLMFNTIQRISEIWAETLERVKSPMERTLINGFLANNYKQLQEFEKMIKDAENSIEELKKMQ